MARRAALRPHSLRSRLRGSMTLATLGLLLLPGVSSAWGRTGHRIVCQVAEERLTPEARELVSELQKGEAHAFAETCLWADDVKYTTQKHTYRYHFINIPAGQGTLNLSRDCEDEDCILWAIEHYAGILADPDESHQERNEALKFLGHFVGDLHQPLHCGRPEDRGGNDIEACFFDDCGHPQKPLNLHAIWDSRILNRGRARWRDLATGLGASIRDAEAQAWSASEPIDWANESYKIADEFVYPQLPKSGVGAAYYQQARPIVEERLKMASVRLAHLLNRIAARLQSP